MPNFLYHDYKKDANASGMRHHTTNNIVMFSFGIAATKNEKQRLQEMNSKEV